MLQLNNKSSLIAAILVLPDPEGVESIYTVVKATYAIGSSLELDDQQLPIYFKDEFYGDPLCSSVKFPSDTSLMKPGTDVLLHGNAWAPAGQPVTESRVRLKVGSIDKTVIVTGDRFWETGVVGTSMSAPEPFETIPLMWERSFGGSDSELNNPDRHAGIPENPVGVGFRMSNGTIELDGMKLPNLELETARVQSWKDRPAPGGFAALAPNYEPRLSFAGTYDDQWQKERLPYLPIDFNPLFFQCAPEGQVTSEFLRGDEIVSVSGASQIGRLEFQLPGVVPQISYTVGNQPQPQPVQLDTLLIEPDENRVSLVWRAVLKTNNKTLQVNEVAVNVVNAR